MVLLHRGQRRGLPSVRGRHSWSQRLQWRTEGSGASRMVCPQEGQGSERELSLHVEPQNLHTVSLRTGSFHLDEPQRGQVLGSCGLRMRQ